MTSSCLLQRVKKGRGLWLWFMKMLLKRWHKSIENPHGTLSGITKAYFSLHPINTSMLKMFAIHNCFSEDLTFFFLSRARESATSSSGTCAVRSQGAHTSANAWQWFWRPTCWAAVRPWSTASPSRCRRWRPCRKSRWLSRDYTRTKQIFLPQVGDPIKSICLVVSESLYVSLVSHVDNKDAVTYSKTSEGSWLFY